MEDFLTFLIVLIFFIGPALRKLFEGQQGNVPRKNRSREEVKKYLERMRALQEQSAALYEEPVVAEVEEEKASWQTENRFSSYEEKESNFDRISQAVEQDVVQHVAEHIDNIHPSMEQAVVEGTTTTTTSTNKKARLEELILENKRFNDIQRAFVLSEIFNKPKSLTQDI
ncbi:hypothetical protein [Candidatus Uabimicrobium amorphum]|uniref:Uncharacterized protein n=1 Tax=Uabimicrobium amorphum TaxID=2596890 RepID=A0A5S9IK92_UABAM|nr:hypothetical protein [Candidatus Uabimicrobium amorphum]BBM83087.1 hypothetical protein UABAM_01437 [Candidatus Uabimicrobium amorphum]